MKTLLSPLMLCAAVLCLSVACSTVSHVHVRSDYEQVDRNQTFRLSVITSPVPAGDDAVGKMWSLIAGRYANHHRDFIVKEARTGAALPEDLCREGIEGVLHLQPTVVDEGSGWSLEVQARLFRCTDRETVWSATAGGSWPSEDPQLIEMTRAYTGELGPGVERHVAPAFRLLRALLDTLPRPRLSEDDDVMEKIEV
ncbi:MAG: MXAN_6521/LA_1396 family lipoprotein, partial [Myxococcota bacterium]|nr:MXAN_6521/LA_1396 family lipoprotein [Myxococcota bacterium]